MLRCYLDYMILTSPSKLIGRVICERATLQPYFTPRKDPVKGSKHQRDHHSSRLSNHSTYSFMDPFNEQVEPVGSATPSGVGIFWDGILGSFLSLAEVSVRSRVCDEATSAV